MTRTENRKPAMKGQAFADIDTPALVIDLDAFERNLARMAESIKEFPVRLRAHAKNPQKPDYRYPADGARRGWRLLPESCRS